MLCDIEFSYVIEKPLLLSPPQSLLDSVLSARGKDNPLVVARPSVLEAVHNRDMFQLLPGGWGVVASLCLSSL